jgi:hypothetical protein
VGEPLQTVRGRPNVVLGVSATDALVSTSRSPDGRPDMSTDRAVELLIDTAERALYAKSYDA